MEENNQTKFRVTEDIVAKLHHRFFNFVIDMVMLSIILLIGLVIFIANNTSTPNEAKEFMDRFMVNGFWQYTVTSSIIVVYYNFFEIFTSRTVGKFCTNTIVVDENGDKANYEAIMFRSLIRAIPLYWLSFIVFPTRGLHDVFSKTYVVNKRKLDENKRKFYSLQRSMNE